MMIDKHSYRVYVGFNAREITDETYDIGAYLILSPCCFESMLNLVAFVNDSASRNIVISKVTLGLEDVTARYTAEKLKTFDHRSKYMINCIKRHASMITEIDDFINIMCK